jgi:hypothetical protein
MKANPFSFLKENLGNKPVWEHSSVVDCLPRVPNVQLPSSIKKRKKNRTTKKDF